MIEFSRDLRCSTAWAGRLNASESPLEGSFWFCVILVDMEEEKVAFESPGDADARKWDTISSNLNDLCIHLNSKISNIKRTLQLRKIDKDPSLKTVLSKVVHEMFLLNSLLNKLEEEYCHQKRLQKKLKDLQESVERDYLEAQHLEENVPIYLPQAAQVSSIGGTLKEKEPCKAEENKPAKKSAKKCIREAPFITDEEFESIPSYMKGRLTCSHVNAVITEINKAVASKYSIMRQPLKSLVNTTRNLYFRFQEEETKDTKGEYFIVEADIEEFTQLKADKRFHNILTILRHCHRVREIRGSRLVRYAIC
ncbi:spindle and kinetochore-associated protein 1 [Notechis scutatus]|uniref:SKA complex subunit 1 n=1 Tax=Notechis scutatus TaxID=8663 RepID=A0A6J1TVK3_9SAUR|nr:spindle and kinetochore-associated protein 1 [Notechis scutatus]